MPMNGREAAGSVALRVRSEFSVGVAHAGLRGVMVASPSTNDKSAHEPRLPAYELPAWPRRVGLPQVDGKYEEYHSYGSTAWWS